MLFFLHFSFSIQKPIQTINETEKTVSAYLSSLTDSPKVSTKKQTKMALSSAQPLSHAKIPKTPKTHSEAREQDDLLALLHTAIQKVQTYPDSAQQMEREGRATVQFILYPNGSISDLKLFHSSGTESLDEAALEAVRKAAPFQHIQSYLARSQIFNIDIVFIL